jgi:ASC-1-like (ASCH) protein
MENNIIELTIQNSKETPWLDWIEQGIKIYEGRVNRGKYKNFKNGDIMVLLDLKTNKKVKVKITLLEYFENFGEAFDILGTKLVPIKDIDKEQVVKLYSQYYSDEDIKKYGVVCIGVQVI